MKKFLAGVTVGYGICLTQELKRKGVFKRFMYLINEASNGNQIDLEFPEFYEFVMGEPWPYRKEEE